MTGVTHRRDVTYDSGGAVQHECDKGDSASTARSSNRNAVDQVAARGAQPRADRRRLLGQEGRGRRSAADTDGHRHDDGRTGHDGAGRRRAATTTAASDGTTETTAARVTADDRATPDTLPPPEGRAGDRRPLVVAGEAEVGAPWTPPTCSATRTARCASARSIEPLVVTDDNLEVQPVLAESIEPNADFTVWTIKLREGITFHDGTPLNADAVIDNLNRTLRRPDRRRRPQGRRQEPGRRRVVTEKLDEYTFTIATGKNGDINEPVLVAAVPVLP